MYDDSVFQNNIVKMHTIIVQYVTYKINKYVQYIKKVINMNIKKSITAALLRRKNEYIRIFLLCTSLFTLPNSWP